MSNNEKNTSRVVPYIPKTAVPWAIAATAMTNTAPLLIGDVSTGKSTAVYEIMGYLNGGIEMRLALFGAYQKQPYQEASGLIRHTINKTFQRAYEHYNQIVSKVLGQYVILLPVVENALSINSSLVEKVGFHYGIGPSGVEDTITIRDQKEGEEGKELDVHLAPIFLSSMQGKTIDAVQGAIVFDTERGISKELPPDYIAMASANVLYGIFIDEANQGVGAINILQGFLDGNVGSLPIQPNVYRALAINPPRKNVNTEIVPESIISRVLCFYVGHDEKEALVQDNYPPIVNTSNFLKHYQRMLSPYMFPYWWLDLLMKQTDESGDENGGVLQKIQNLLQNEVMFIRTIFKQKGYDCQKINDEELEIMLRLPAYPRIKILWMRKVYEQGKHYLLTEEAKEEIARLKHYENMARSIVMSILNKQGEVKPLSDLASEYGLQSPPGISERTINNAIINMGYALYMANSKKYISDVYAQKWGELAPIFAAAAIGGQYYEDLLFAAINQETMGEYYFDITKYFSPEEKQTEESEKIIKKLVGHIEAVKKEIDSNNTESSMWLGYLFWLVDVVTEESISAIIRADDKNKQKYYSALPDAVLKALPNKSDSKYGFIVQRMVSAFSANNIILEGMSDSKVISSLPPR